MRHEDKVGVEDVTEDVKPESASASQPGVDDASSASAFGSQTEPPAGRRNSLTHGVAERIFADMKYWYEERVDDESVANTWKHLHTVLFKKVRVPYGGDMWCTSNDTEDGLPMVVSAEYVALQVKKVIQRREQWLRDRGLPLDSIMNEVEKDAFLVAVKAEYHGSEDQQRRQDADTAAGKRLQSGKKQR